MLWAWVGQALDPDKSCNKALARLRAHRASLGFHQISPDTSAYCRARKRLPEGLFSRLFRRLGLALSQRAQPEDLWRGRVVKLVDGSSSSMPDTAANQSAYPQPSGQAEGCGFPVVGFVGVFCMATGAALDLVLGKWFRHDLALFYFLRHAFETGDIMLADRGFCAYAEMALFAKRGVDVVLRLHQARKPDFRRGRIIGVLDHIVQWDKPVQRPPGLRKKDYRRLPPDLEVRELRYAVAANGFRTKSITLVTTLRNQGEYPAADLAELYFRRWDIEVDFRHIKITMGMDVLRGKTPDIVRKEIWTHLLTYNLIRSVMWEAATTHGVTPSRISFKGTMQQVSATKDLFVFAAQKRKAMAFEYLLDFITEQIVPSRPFRAEPRVRKRRPKNYPLMTRPRAQLKASIGV